MKSKELLGVVFGTFVLILLGDGVVANVGLAPRLAAGGYNWNTIVVGWCFAVILSGLISGAHNNPAVTVALAIKGDFPWSKVLPYVLAETLGAFLGAAAVFLVYRDGLVAAGMPNIWSTGPGSTFGQAFWGGSGGLLRGSTPWEPPAWRSSWAPSCSCGGSWPWGIGATPPWPTWPP